MVSKGKVISMSRSHTEREFPRKDDKFNLLQTMIKRTPEMLISEKKYNTHIFFVAWSLAFKHGFFHGADVGNFNILHFFFFF